MLSDHFDGSHWKEDFCQDPIITNNGGPSKNVALEFCADGVNPYKRKSYSMWFGAMSILNLPPWARHSLDAMHLCFIVPGPRKPVCACLAPLEAPTLEQFMSCYRPVITCPSACSILQSCASPDPGMCCMTAEGFPALPEHLYGRARISVLVRVCHPSSRCRLCLRHSHQLDLSRQAHKRHLRLSRLP